MRGPSVILALLAAASGDDWTRWRGPDGTGVVADAAWNPAAVSTPKIRWRAALGLGHSSVSLSGGKLYTMGSESERDIVYCLDAETGRELWRHAYPCKDGSFPGPRATPVVEGGLVYTLSREGEAFCLEAETGKVKWEKDFARDHGAEAHRWGISGSPLIAGEAVIYNVCASGVALNRKTGEKIWAGAAGKGGYATPVRFRHRDREWLAIFSSKQLVGVDPATGEVRFAFPWMAGDRDVNIADPVYVDGRLFVTAGYDRGCALVDIDGSEPKAVWENRNLSAHFASPVYYQGHLYGVDGQTGQGQLRCLDPRTGEILWTRKGGYENFMVAAGRILAIDRKGILTVSEASPSGYKEISRGAVLDGKAKNWTPPVLCGGRIYCRNSEGDLVCVDVR